MAEFNIPILGSRKEPKHFTKKKIQSSSDLVENAVEVPDL